MNEEHHSSEEGDVPDGDTRQQLKASKESLLSSKPDSLTGSKQEPLKEKEVRERIVIWSVVLTVLNVRKKQQL